MGNYITCAERWYHDKKFSLNTDEYIMTFPYPYVIVSYDFIDYAKHMFIKDEHGDIWTGQRLAQITNIDTCGKIGQVLEEYRMKIARVIGSGKMKITFDGSSRQRILWISGHKIFTLTYFY